VVSDDRVPDVRAWLARPEYTGGNRCLPCTAVNVVIAAVLAAGIAVVSGPVGALAFGAFLVVVYYRGYLLPGTPTLTRRYLPDSVLAAFGKSRPEPTVEAASPDELRGLLTAADVATEGDGDIELTPAFRSRWDDRLPSAGGPNADAVRAALGVDELERLDDAAFVVDGRSRLRWESTGALAADVAAATALRGWIDGWDALEPDERRDVLRGLRLLRTRCPVCDGPVRTTADRLEHCCRRPQVAVRAVCEECERPLVDLVAPESAADPWLELAGAAVAAGPDG
jgi:hypothetical protein